MAEPAIDRQKDGADAFKALVDMLGDFENDALYLIDSAGDKIEDYLAITDAVVQAVEINYVAADPLHREGFARALAGWLMITANGSTPTSLWDPLESSEQAFAQRRRLAEVAGEAQHVR